MSATPLESAPPPVAAVAPPRPRRDRTSWAPVIFVAPALVLLAVFFFLPVLAAFGLSLTDYDLYAVVDPSNARVVGLANYGSVLGDAVFWQAMLNTALFVVFGAPLTILASLAAAVALNAPLVKARSALRLAFFLPVVTTLVAVAIVWRYLYEPEGGLINTVLGAVGIHGPAWLTSPTWALPALILMAVWKNFGYNMVIFLAGLQTIPASLYEAAELDGAGRWAQFRHVTVPMLAPTTLFVSLITMIGYFQFFAEPYVMTEGGPLNRTLSLVLLMYREGFRFWRVGYAAAVAFTLFIVVFALTLLQLRAQKRTGGA